MKTFILLIITLTLSSCGSIFFQPTSYLYSDPLASGHKLENIYLKTSDGIQLHAWHFKNSKMISPPKSLILFFHGNAQNMSAHYLSLAWILKHGHDFIIFDYRGYGTSDGNPNLKDVNNDSLAALNYALKYKKENNIKKLIIYGESLGGTLALRALEDLKQQKQIDLLVLNSTFLSYKDIAFDRATSNFITFLISPLTYILFSDEMSPKKNLSKLQIPTLIIHGDKDPIIPIKFGKEIYDSLQCPKEFWEIKNGKHIDIFSRKKYQKKFLRYVHEYI